MLVTTDYKPDGTFHGYTEINIIDSDIKEKQSELKVIFNGSWLLKNNILSKKYIEYKVVPLNLEGGNMVNMLKEIVDNQDDEHIKLVDIGVNEMKIKTEKNNIYLCEKHI